MADSVYTIGHSTHSIERLIKLLTMHGVTAVADVRSHPYSRFNPQFNREHLRASLRTAGISYVFLGRELGARTDARDCYVEGKVQYDLLARTRVFQAGLDRIVKGISSHRVALLCAEKDPLTCHRGILICRHLVCRGIGTEHILEDGRLERHDQALNRLLVELDLADGDLFRNREDLIDDAYDRRGQQIAYTMKELSTENPRSEVQL